MLPTDLLAGPYLPPVCERGQRVFCLFRDCDIIVTSIHDGRIPWPKGCRPEEKSQPSLIVNEDLVRAIRTESAKGIMHWFGVGCKPVWRWRRRFKIKGKFGTDGSKRLHRIASEIGTAVVRGQSLDLTEEQRADRAVNSMITMRRLLVERGNLNPDKRPWRAEEIALLGTDTDRAIAVLLGRSRLAVWHKRKKIRVPRFKRGLPK